ncbi:MAG TPA: 4-(cytidine 5'-diphospho)-2-C-methyl-D-erythritol kinase [Candidatus Binataceae bacterium]|nr:4-(cytidine 5'-diphospho)-2-C-methyl-D-erythritol kinase [Candidatus Binataceae bacterium]
MVKLLSESAPAKINLFLRVVGRRPDGYHELDSVFLPVSLSDRVTLAIRPDAPSRVSIRCDDAALPTDDRNLAVRAANAFMAGFGIEMDIAIELRKRIPMGAGLGGGSSDAGAVLRMLAALCRIDDSTRLAEIAVRLGADVPFFLNPMPARVGGIGEQLTPLPSLPDLSFVIAVPPLETPTAAVYRALRPEDWSGPASEEDIRAIIEGGIEPRLLVNDLAKPAMAQWPAIASLKAILEEAGAYGAAMTGSGCGVFGIFDSLSRAETAANEVRRRAPDSRVYAVSTTNPQDQVNRLRM